MILIDHLTKKHGNQTILDDISFKVDGGELITIVGGSGAGKTTLIHCLIGAEKIDHGTIKVDNLIVNKLSHSEVQDYRRRIGIVFQDYKLLPKKTVFENVAFALEVAGHDKDFINQRTSDVLKLTGLEARRNSFPGQLSGGEKQRVAIARALVHAPQLLLADEPTGNLDPENTSALAKLFLKINQSGTTIILSTHNKEVVKILNSRVLSLDNGKLISDKRAPASK